MILMAGFELPIYAIREQVASALHLIIQISRMSDGTRKVVGVTEVTGQEGNTISMQDLFLFERRGTDAEGRILGSTVPTGIRPHYQNVFAAAGIDLPVEMFLRSA
jgi:pilus assembly protein CpaF